LFLFLSIREFAIKIKRPFAVRYNPYNQSIEILSNAQQVANVFSDLKGDVCIIFDALKKMENKMNSEFIIVIIQVESHFCFQF
jgi:hypothetical protein